ncbi:MAG: penicillin-binding transpeptidase domain-containing protein [Opitutae bacterium]
MSPDDTLNKISVPSAPITPWRMYLIFTVFAVGFIYIFCGLFYRQLIQSKDLIDQANSQSEVIVWRPPTRGLIKDRNEITLVENRVRWSVRANLLSLEGEIDKEYKSLVKAEKAKESNTKINYEALHQEARVNILNRWLKKIWFVIDASNQKKSPSEKKRVKFLANSPERQVNVSALAKHMRDSRILKFTLISDLTFPELRNQILDEEADRSIARFIEQFPVDGPITIESDMIRSYPFGSLACHTLGYVKDTNQLPEDFDANFEISFKKLSKSKYTGKVGAEGVEQTHDYALRGSSGWERWTKTSAGYKRELLESYPSREGGIIRLSLDANVQVAAEKALGSIKDTVGNPLPGAAVMLDVNTGEILAITSQPSYDPNRLASKVTNKYYDEIQDQGGWMNRAIQGLYAPGSTFKIITAITGMRSGKIDYDDILDCGPSLRVGNRDFPEHEPYGFGQVDIEKMLAISCNVWNYRVGLMVGPDLLAQEARRFGLDKVLLKANPGVMGAENASQYELPSPARKMVVPDSTYKEQLGQGSWTAGDTVNTSIGQGFILTTPLHMACFAASIARGETRTTPTIFHDPTRIPYHQDSRPIGLNRNQLNAIRSGMIRCVTEGTARSIQIPGFQFAAKTGTAEYFKSGQKAHLAWIIGYAPAKNPKVAFAVLVEGQVDTNTWGGLTAGPVAQAMIKEWINSNNTPSEE